MIPETSPACRTLLPLASLQDPDQRTGAGVPEGFSGEAWVLSSSRIEAVLLAAVLPSLNPVGPVSARSLSLKRLPDALSSTLWKPWTNPPMACPIDAYLSARAKAAILASGNPPVNPDWLKKFEQGLSERFMGVFTWNLVAAAEPKPASPAPVRPSWWKWHADRPVTHWMCLSLAGGTEFVPPQKDGPMLRGEKSP